MVFGNGAPTISIRELMNPDVYSLENGYGGMKQSRASSSQPSVSLSFRNVDVFVKPGKKRVSGCCGRTSDVSDQKKLLHGVSGEAKSGQLLAIMGSSGAGKTTLLNVLTNRNLRLLKVEGEVLVNGQNVGESISRMSAYVQQDDLFIGTLKVREHLKFQALLRMDTKYSYKDRMRRVEEVIVELGLGKCADTLIGDSNSKGISGGESKRLAFAAEVLTNPPLMFCDEPTSGLDSFMAHSVVQVLKDMAQGGRTIVCTIHQPSSETFELFDHLLLLAEGRVAFRGESCNALAFFERAGLRCPINYNPSDFYIHNLAIVPGKEAESRQIVLAICDQFARENNTLGICPSPRPSIVDTEMSPQSNYKASWCTQFRALLWRSWISMVREQMTTKIRFMQAVGLGLMLGVVYLNQRMDEKGVMNINGLIFILIMNISFSNMMTVINVFMFEKPIFLREHWNGMYRTDAYFLCKTLAEV